MLLKKLLFAIVCVALAVLVVVWTNAVVPELVATGESNATAPVVTSP